jgi:hypothetical protein
MRLFRQPASGDWDGLFVQIESELAALVTDTGAKPIPSPKTP